MSRFTLGQSRRMIASALLVAGFAVVALFTGGAEAVRDGRSTVQQPRGGLRFFVEIDGITMGEFAEVEGLDSETEVVEFRDGTDPTVVRKIPGRTKYSNIVLKRGYIQNGDLWVWRKATIEGSFEPRDGAVILQNQAGRELLRYEFFDAWPVKWKGVDLDGKGTDIAVESIELSVERIERS